MIVLILFEKKSLNATDRSTLTCGEEWGETLPKLCNSIFLIIEDGLLLKLFEIVLQSTFAPVRRCPYTEYL